MATVASSGSISRVNGPGRADLAEAVASHRHNRRWSQKSTALRGGISPGTLKNVEGKRTDLLPPTLTGLDTAFGWEPGTAEAILVERAQAPALPSRQPVSAGGINRRLAMELEGQEVYETRAFEIPGTGTKLVISAMGDDDLADLDAIRAAILELDGLFRKLHDDEG